MALIWLFRGGIRTKCLRMYSECIDGFLEPTHSVSANDITSKIIVQYYCGLLEYFLPRGIV
jgi:hypothetical protein